MFGGWGGWPGEGPSRGLLRDCTCTTSPMSHSPVHAAMDGLPVLVSAGPPGVVPEAAPVALLLVADDLGNLAALPGELGGPAQHGHARGSRPDDTYPLVWHSAAGGRRLCGKTDQGSSLSKCNLQD